MSVEFNDENKAARAFAEMQSAEKPASGLVNWLVTSGIAQTSEAANKILIGVTVAAFLATGIIIYKMNSGGGGTQLTPEQIKVMEQNMPGAPR